MRIKRLWELTPKENKELFSFLAKQPVPGEWDSFGLRFSTSYLKEISCKVLLLPLEMMGLYEDHIIHLALVDNNIDFLSNQIFSINISDVPSIDQLNATSIGNIAAVASNCREDNTQKRALEILNIFYEQYVSKHGASLL